MPVALANRSRFAEDIGMGWEDPQLNLHDQAPLSHPRQLHPRPDTAFAEEVPK